MLDISFLKGLNQSVMFFFSIINSDIWGPSHVPSFSFSSFVTFIDEFLKCT